MNNTLEPSGADPVSQPPATEPVGHQGARVDVAERPAWAVDGFFALGVALVLVAVMVWIGTGMASSTESTTGRSWIVAGLALVVVLIASSLVVVSPGTTKVVQFFGRYVGTTRRNGLSMVVPLTTRRTVSIRVHNFETNALKVNDASGNPVEIAAIVVWQVADTARASFAVERYQDFVRVQSEAALRHVATTRPYDDPTGDEESLRGSTDLVSAELAHEVAERVAVAGVEIVEVRISHLAYAPEIAQAMLRRQQASAVVAARSRIVEGAVGMVEMALERLESQAIVELDDERRAAMVSNLLVVLCSEQSASPVLNTGSLYT
jgi:regulator of protease activity HflC (stomatin/prohibitin superfamily)